MKSVCFFIAFAMLSMLALAQTSSVYIRGTGYNYSVSRQIKLNGTYLVNSGGRGLTLTIIDAATHSHVSSLNYDTYGSTTASDNLASALNSLKRGQIGILTSYDAWEHNMTPVLREAATRLGLFKLAGGLGANYSRRPYAAIFRGSGTADLNTEPSQIAYEVMQSNDPDAGTATIATFLIDDAFIGNNLTNALISADGSISVASVLADHKGNVGIGTTSPDAKLIVKGTIHSSEVKVDLNGSVAPDFVFEEDYALPGLAETESYIKTNKHLPDIPSGQEMEEHGIDLKEMNLKLLQKVEELTLYLIEQNKVNAEQSMRIQLLEAKIARRKN